MHRFEIQGNETHVFQLENGCENLCELHFTGVKCGDNDISSFLFILFIYFNFCVFLCIIRLLNELFTDFLEISGGFHLATGNSRLYFDAVQNFGLCTL